MEIKKEKFNIYEPLLSDICSMEDKHAGKLVKLICGYVFDNDEFVNERKDIAEISYWANQTAIEKMKKEQRTKNNVRHIIIYNGYYYLFKEISDNYAGRLFKKIVDEKLNTEYLKNAERDLTLTLYYNTIKNTYERYRSDKVKDRLNDRHDFGKLMDEFPDFDWFNFDKDKHKNLNCVAFSDWLKRNNIDGTYMRIDEAVSMYEEIIADSHSFRIIEDNYEELDWNGIDRTDEKYKKVNFHKLYDYMEENDYHSILSCSRMTVDDVLERYNKDKKRRKK